MSAIKYRINSITSESENYPAFNLVNGETHLGWQSQFTSSYPQQIQLQFFLPIRTKTLKLIFHQYKIPSRVQIFVRLTKKQNYRKLGYVIPNDNTQSNFEDKEIKTMYFEFPCNYIKLIFYQNYKNQMNLFNQVAIDGIECTGQVMSLSQTKNLDLQDVQTSEDQFQQENNSSNLRDRGQLNTMQNNNNPSNRLQNTSTSDEILKMFFQVYNLLETQKQEAVQHEDFQRAAHLKNAIMNFKDMQNEIKKLENQKKNALQNQDFDLCHRLKNDILRKKQEFIYRKEQLIGNQMSYMSQNSHSRIIQNRQQNRNVQNAQQKEKYYSNNLKNQNIKDYFGTPQREKQSQIYQHPSIKTNINNNQNQNQMVTHQNNNNKVHVDHNEQIVPALINKNNPKTLEELGAFPTVKTKPNKSVVKQKTAQEKSQLIQQFYGKSNNYSTNQKNSLLEMNNSRDRSISGHLQQSKRSSRQNRDYDLPTQRSEYEDENDKMKQVNKNMKIEEVNDQSFTNPPTEYTEESTQELITRYDLEPLDHKVRLKIQHYFDTVKEPYWQMISNKNWKTKEVALQTIYQHGQIINKQSYMCMLEFVSMAIGDNHTVIIQLCLKLLKKIIDSEIVFSLSHLPYFVDGIINWLLGLLQNTNTKIVEESFLIFINLGMINFLSLQTIIFSIIKYKQNSKLDPKFIIMKISLMVSIIEKYADAVNHFKEIITWIVGYLQDPNNKVKNEAGYLLLIIVDQLGEDKVINLLKNKPNTLQAFYNLLNASSIQSSKGQSRIKNSLINQSLVADPKKNSSISKEKISNNLQNNSQVSKNNPSSFMKNNKSQVNRDSQISGSYNTNNNQKNRNPWQNPSKYQDKDMQVNARNVYSVQKKSNNSSKMVEQQQNVQLQYSRESSQIYTQEPSNYQEESERPINYYVENTQRRQQDDQQKSIRVMTDQQQQYEQQQQQDICEFCLSPLNGTSVRDHLMKDCVVIVCCEECQGRIFIKQMTQHFLTECDQKYKYQQCKKCGLAFPISQINQHVGRGLCRLMRGQGWQRCQFCGSDIVQNDQKWVQHAHKCPMLPEKRQPFSSKKLTTQ